MKNNCPQVVVQNFFEPCILFLLLEKPSYGYDIQKQLKEKCTCEVNTGNLYRCLSRMQKLGYIERSGAKSELGPKRYMYTITESGKDYLNGWIISLEKQRKIISILINNYKKIL
ncbi:MAG: PadR family transcriptional regulator [Candidatus Roizmanbacteria bacterium]|nr:PadR family transcriptional regulator [Candidatus Roizmanbacteria bacterium]